MTWSPTQTRKHVECTPMDTRGPKRLWGAPAGVVQRHRGDTGRLVKHDYLCPVHGRFELEVPASDVPDEVPCTLDSWSVAGFSEEYPTREAVAEALRARCIGVDEVRLETQRCGDTATWSPSTFGIWVSAGEVAS